MNAKRLLFDVMVFITLTVFLILAFSTISVNASSMITNNPVADAYVNSEYPNRNYGSSTTLDVEGESYDRRIFINFSIANIVINSNLTCVRLRLYIWSNLFGLERNVSRVIGSWTESLITWNNQPSVNVTNSVVGGRVDIGWDTFDVTEMVKDAKNKGLSYISFRIKMINEDVWFDNMVSYRSKEYGGTYSPQLVAIYNNSNPLIGEFKAPSITYAEKFFLLNATINDADGIKDFANAQVELSGDVILKWDNATNTFSFSGSYVALDAESSQRIQLNSTAYKLCWRIKFSWSYTGGSIDVISTNTRVVDIADASGSNSKTGIFTFKNTLSDAYLWVDDYRCNPSQTLTFSGVWYYQGTTVAPPDGDYQVKIKLSGVQKGSIDTTLVNGYFCINDVVAESTVNAYHYTVEASHMASPGSFPTVIVDRMVITMAANTTSPNIGGYISMSLTAKYEYSGTAVHPWTVNVMRNSTHFATGNFTDGGYEGVMYIYDVENASDGSFGLTAFTANTVTVYWSTFVALTVKTLDLDGNILTKAIVYFNATPVQVDNNGLAIKSGVTRFSIIEVKVKWMNVWVNGTWSVNMTETKTINARCQVWSLTINARDNGGTMLMLSPTNFIWIFSNGTEVNQTKTDGSWIFKIMNGTHYYRIQYQGQWVSENITLPIYSKNATVINQNCWVYSLTVYVQTTPDSPTPNSPIIGASLTLHRTSDNTTLNGLYGLPADPKTTTYNSTHAAYTWTQLANQTSSYTITADITGSGGAKSATTALTSNTEVGIQLVYPVGGGTSEGSVPTFPTPSPIIPKFPPPKPIYGFGEVIWDNRVAVSLIVGVAIVFSVPFFARKEKYKGFSTYKKSYSSNYEPKKKKKEKPRKWQRK